MSRYSSSHPPMFAPPATPHRQARTLRPSAAPSPRTRASIHRHAGHASTPPAAPPPAPRPPACGSAPTPTPPPSGSMPANPLPRRDARQPRGNAATAGTAPTPIPPAQSTPPPPPPASAHPHPAHRSAASSRASRGPSSWKRKGTTAHVSPATVTVCGRVFMIDRRLPGFRRPRPSGSIPRCSACYGTRRSPTRSRSPPPRSGLTRTCPPTMDSSRC